MSDIHEITKQINGKVHEQRDVLLDVERNTDSALTNAEGAEEQIIQAAAKQKMASKCMLWLIGIITITVLIIILSVVVSLA